MNLSEVCRLCLVKSMKTCEELFFPIDEVFEKKFNEVTSLTLDSSEQFPSTICISCVTEFEDFYNYRSGLMQKQRRLNLLLGIKEESAVKPEFTVKKQLEDIQNESQYEENLLEQEDELDENKLYENPEMEYEENEIEYQEQEHDDINETDKMMVFEEVLEHEEENEGETYEVELSEESHVYVRDCDVEEFVESTDECVEELEHVDDEQILFAIKEDDLSDNCIIVKTEDSYLENISIGKQKRKYIKQEKEKEKLFKCWMENCNAAFSFRSTMKKHMTQMHMVVCDKKTCLMCGRQFEEYSDFLNHVKKHTRKSECHICKLTFVSEEKMQAHLERVHKNDQNERSFHCHLCDASFKRKEHVNSHIVYRHTENRQFSCKDCTSTFLTRQDLKNHEKSHQQLKKNCAYCTYECRDLKSIKLHCLKLHNTTKIYKCACEEAFDMHKDYQSHKKNCYSVVDSTTTE
ncbi:unnamed protein product [Chironomus riparius]|uniref:Uncharacterized protein n=1 Tax=Chironomus riparius TaxID=315576 RepID=A0A9N9RUU1_9DIPT|nr:unnamed protein product [Chironomus riparius]